MHGLEHIQLTTGALTGRLRDEVVEFRGVPYAAAPTGVRRFAPPAPAEPWGGVLDATRDGAIPPQPPSRVFASMGEITGPQSEDCLTLTIRAPRHRNGDRLPVLVWLHGGGFASGAGSLSWYDGSYLAARHGVIVVGVNYRLGALGYLSVPGVLAGNLAVLDQAAALRWVHENIEAFGGDPGNVTLVGESGGGHTIASFLTMPGTEGLFQRAILQSPPLGIGLATPERAARSGHAFLEALGLQPGMPELLARLREIPVADLLSAQNATAGRLGAFARGDLRPPFMPTEFAPHEAGDLSLLECAADNAVRRGVALMIGWTRDEANLFYPAGAATPGATDPGLDVLARELAGDAAGQALAGIRARRPDGSPGQWFRDLVTDASFRLPSLRLADRAARAGAKVFVYQFDWRSPNPELGACHCLDIPFMFGTWEAWAGSPMLAGADRDQLRALSDTMMQCWSTFAGTGDPGFPGWSEGRQPIHHFDTEPWTEQP